MTRPQMVFDFPRSDLDELFSKTSTVIGQFVTNEEKEEEKKSLINLDDIDVDDNNFDDYEDDEIDNDIVSFLSLHDDINKSHHHNDDDNNPNNNNSNICRFVTDADKDEMMKLLKNNLIKSPCNKQPNVENDDYSQLLVDDDDVYDFDDIDIDDIDEMIEKIKNNDSQKQIDQEEEKDSFEFKKANDKQCTKPSEICYQRARSLFLDIEILLRKEIAAFKKYEPNKININKNE
ncbi:hypothetical protein DERF_009089 [Dermatophagoides farinae]|uniref:Uncharacterized protein n=1 Tax=Dermatophagoides farinae TaxID=6954 RepID=A0A922HX78_DERFA|nr:hypothetical protein DERF_009089 [Dermatophagoides farinae]